MAKAVVCQNNRFVYAQYNMTANELKFFYYMISKIDSKNDEIFNYQKMPVLEITTVWNAKNTDYNYIAEICTLLSKRVYIEDFKVLDENNKEKMILDAFPLFEHIHYEKGKGYVLYKLNNSLIKHLLKLKENFTKFKFITIQDMKSFYSMRIYNILLSELCQNKTSLKINLFVLQNILEVPKGMREWRDFKRDILFKCPLDKKINYSSTMLKLRRRF